MKQRSYRSVVNFLARLCLGGVLIGAAVSKLFDLNQFAQRIGDFGLVFDTLVKPTAWAVVVAELVIGVGLFARRRGSLVGAAAMLLTFVGVLTYGVVLGLDVDCGCFGPAVHFSLGTQLLVDFGLLLICAIIYATDRR